MNYPKVIGKIYRTIGMLGLWISLGSLVIAYWTDAVFIDITCFFWIWLGDELGDKNPKARKWAIRVAIFCLFIISNMIISWSGLDHIHFTGSNNGPVFALVYLVLLTIPGLCLLTKRAKAQFT